MKEEEIKKIIENELSNMNSDGEELNEAIENIVKPNVSHLHQESKIKSTNKEESEKEDK